MTPPEPPPADPAVPHVLLFGHRGAGKSALIGALLQAGATQGDVLRGEVVHSSVDLPRIRDAVYGGAKLEPHQTELVSYTLRLRPWREGTEAVGEPLVVVLDDCDGRAAEALLAHPEPITQRAPDSPVARAVIGADAIVLLVDAASTDEQLTEAFVAFDEFLDTVGRARTDARAVGGFPVFLVLTQCDRLARQGDTLPVWEARVAARVDEAWKKFDAHLKHAEPEGAGPAPFLPFGSIVLNVFAAAVRRPVLPGTQATAHHPYHVAELFRDCFAEARAHRARVLASDTRLKWTVRSVIAALVVMLAGLGAVALFPPQPAGPDLAERVRDYMEHEPPAAVRLADGEIGRNRKSLIRFTGDRAFPDLEPDLRSFVESRVKEIDDYDEYRAKLALAVPPERARTLTELEQIRAALVNDLALPGQYAWGETAAGRLRDKWLADCTAIRAVVEDLVKKYRGYSDAAVARMVTRAFDVEWLAALGQLVADGDKVPVPLKDPIRPDSALNQPHGEAVTYNVPYQFDEVYRARREWERTRDRLTSLRDLADALGATTAPNRPAPVLALPEPNGVDSATLARARLADLHRLYPHGADDYSDWELIKFPEPTPRSELAPLVKKSFDAGLRHVQKLMKVQDTKDGWKALAATLDEPAYRDWGSLLHLLARLQNPAAPDPVAELKQFLADLDTRKYVLDLQDGLTLSVPLDLTSGLDRVEPVGPLAITLTHGQEPPKAFKFAVKKGELRGGATVYQLVPEPDARIEYAPGDDLRAELPVRAGAQMLVLRWESGPSNTFRFDRLAREPRLTKLTGGTEPAPGVKLTPVAAGAIPPFPVLMPVK
jgi:hypothetical protein